MGRRQVPKWWYTLHFSTANARVRHRWWLVRDAIVYDAVTMTRRMTSIAIPTVAVLTAILACSPSAPAEGQGNAAGTARIRVAAGAARLDTARLARAYARATELPRLRSLLVEWRGLVVGERYFRGATRATPANIKSASKSVISALVGIAIARGDLRDTHQTLGELLPTETRGLDTAK